MWFIVIWAIALKPSPKITRRKQGYLLPSSLAHRTSRVNWQNKIAYLCPKVKEECVPEIHGTWDPVLRDGRTVALPSI